MHSLEVSKYVNHIIINDPEIDKIIDGNLFQLFSKQGSVKPYIISSRGTLSYQLTKDVRQDKSIGIIIDIYTDIYQQGVELQIKLDKLLSKTHHIDGNFFYMYVEDFSEMYQNDSYIQTISFVVVLS